MRQRQKTVERGYDATHARLRKEWAPHVAAGEVICWRCRTRIYAGEPWDLGHDDYDRTVYRGPEHQRCNRATRSRQRRWLRRAVSLTTSRQW